VREKKEKNLGMIYGGSSVEVAGRENYNPKWGPKPWEVGEESLLEKGRGFNTSHPGLDDIYWGKILEEERQSNCGRAAALGLITEVAVRCRWDAVN